MEFLLGLCFLIIIRSFCVKMNGKSQIAMDGDDFEWTPPTEAELKVIQAKRERADKISKLMGEYLLKGYRMMGTTCKICDTILLKDRQQRDYCVACNELETEHAKDDPALSQAAAISQVQEHQHAIARKSPKDTATNPGKSNGHPLPSSSSSSLRQPAKQASTLPRPITEAMETQDGLSTTRPNMAYRLDSVGDLPRQYSPVQIAPEVRVVVGTSLEAVVKKLAWASQELQSTHSVEASAGLCNLIKLCADAISSLNRLGPQELTD